MNSENTSDTTNAVTDSFVVSKEQPKTTWRKSSDRPTPDIPRVRTVAIPYEPHIVIGTDL